MACAVSAVHADPLTDDDLSPLIAGIGLPSAVEGADLVARGSLRWQLGIATASHSMQDDDGVERLLFDGETTRTSLRLDYGISDRLQIGLEVPWILNEPGNLDRVIKQWHDWFGLPDGLRNIITEDQLDFRYEDSSVLLLDQQSRSKGLGDARLLGAWQLERSAGTSTALRASVKFPTGDSTRLTGSGAVDVSIGYAANHRQLAGREGLRGFYQAHLVFVGEPDRLADRSRTVIAKLSGGVSWRVASRLDLNAQASFRSAAYDSDIRVLGDPALQLNVGGRILLSERLRLAISVGEDVRVDTAPDVTFGLALEFTGGR